jgi:putative oxidoreductase
MNKLRVVCAVLLALPFLVFGANYFIHIFPMPAGDGSAGAQLLQAMREGGLMSALAFSHVVVGVLLLVPRTRFLGAILQLPISIGIVAFHFTMQPAGLLMGSLLLLLNLAVLADPLRWRCLVDR